MISLSTSAAARAAATDGRTDGAARIRVQIVDRARLSADALSFALAADPTFQSTARTHLKNIRVQLGVNTTLEAILVTVRMGWIELPTEPTPPHDGANHQAREDHGIRTFSADGTARI